MRLIDADALKRNMEFVCMGIMAGTENYNAPITEIDNAPTVEPFEPDYVGAERVEARQRGYEDGYRNGMEIGKTLNPRIKQGEWKETGYETGALGITYRQTQCSNCGWEQALPMWLNFCPNCGAEMRKGGAE